MIGIMSENFLSRLRTLGGESRSIDEGAYLFHQGDLVESIYVVEEGMVELARYAPNGVLTVLQRAGANMVLAEASAYSDKYLCDGIAAQQSSVCEVAKQTFLEQIGGDEEFATAWAEHLAKEVQDARHRSEILTRKTVAERLDGWLDWRGEELPEKGQWKDLADELGVSPEALYRELAKRRGG